MAKRKRYDTIGTGEPCPKCTQPMERREHKQITERLLNQPFYFKEWDYCWGCKHLQHYEVYKVENNSKKNREMRRKLQYRTERQEQLNFIGSIMSE